MGSNSSNINQIPASHTTKIKLAEAKQQINELNQKIERMKKIILELQSENEKLKA